MHAAEGIAMLRVSFKIKKNSFWADLMIDEK